MKLNVGSPHDIINRLECILHELAIEQGKQGCIYDVATLVAEIRRLNLLRRKIERMINQ